MSGRGGYILTLKQDVTAVTGKQARQLRHETCFAGAIGANKRMYFIWYHLQTDMVCGQQSAKAFDQILNIEQRLLAHAWPFVSSFLARLKKLDKPRGAKRTTANKNHPM